MTVWLIRMGWIWVMLGCETAAAQLPTEPVPLPVTAAPEPWLEEVVVTRPEPRYAAPTRRDRIGRIWAPVYINDQGPFRMVLDTGATHTSIMPSVAARLNLPADEHHVRVRGTTGSAVVGTVQVDTVQMGDLLLHAKRLPVIADALGGAEGVIGNEGLADRRVHIDFRHDIVLISKSHREPAPPGYLTLPVKLVQGRLLQVQAYIGSVPVAAIIDTGSQITIANLAARQALRTRLPQSVPSSDQIVGVTLDVMVGEGMQVPPLVLDVMEIHTHHMTFLDLDIFSAWHMTDRPAVVVGMDALGLLDVLIIDYARHELQVRMRN